MAYASLFDTYEEYNDDASSDEPVSIIHLKRRVQDLYDCYVEMYPEISLTISIPGTLLSNLIYDILLKQDIYITRLTESVHLLRVARLKVAFDLNVECR